MQPRERLIQALFVDSPLQVDGHLNKSIWQSAPACELAIPRSLIEQGQRIQEGGLARFAWDQQFLYVGLELADSDLVAEGSNDGEMHNALGDTCELLIKPDDQTWYWEFHVTPAGRKSSFFFPGRGRICLPSCLRHPSELRVGAQCNGTLNDWKVRDLGWTAEMAIPVEELTAYGGSFGPGSRWRVLVGRYNYSRFLTTRGPELSSAPQLSRVDFHLHDEYALLDFTH